MKLIRLTLNDLWDKEKPFPVYSVLCDVDDLNDAIQHVITLPATMDARTNHPYSLVVERVETR